MLLRLALPVPPVRRLAATTLAAVVALATGCSTAAVVDLDPAAETAARFESVRREPEALRAFLAEMPVGADLHHHLGGAAPPSMLIDFAAADGLCLPREAGVAWRLTAAPCAGDRRPVAGARGDRGSHDERSARRSMRGDPEIDRLEANDHFFGIFPQIRLANRDLGRLLAGVRSLSAAEGILYLETSTGWVPDRAALAELYDHAWRDDLAGLRRDLLADPRFGALRDATVAGLAAQWARAEELLRCGTPASDPGCDVEVRFQRIAIRTQVPIAVFAQALLSYEVARASPLVVAVNLVAPETDSVSLRDYALHMRIYGELGRLYPGVRRTLHAAEMTDELAIELGARDHLRLAVAPVEEGGAAAERVGHGVALDATTSRDAVLARMRERGVAVELNLRSNALLLGVRGAAHPLPDYLAAGVPIVLSTDDPGLMGTDLREQFLLAAGYEEVDYPTLKAFARNSVAYSFLPAPDRARLLARLDVDFDAFERGFAG